MTDHFFDSMLEQVANYVTASKLKSEEESLKAKRNVEDFIISIRQIIGYPRNMKIVQLDTKIRKLIREIEKLKSEKNHLKS